MRSSFTLPVRQAHMRSPSIRTSYLPPLLQTLRPPCQRSISHSRRLCSIRAFLQDLPKAEDRLSPTTRPLGGSDDLLLSTTTTTRDPQEAELGWQTTFNEDYEICGQLGAGAFGQVYLGQHKVSGQQVAVKMMPKVRGKQSRASSIRAISREALLQRLVQSPGVASLIECYEDANSVQLITELCRGGDLRRHVEVYGTLDEACLAGVALEMLLVLQACHKQGIVFADVKPANFCLANEHQGACNLRAIDFGCSQRLGPSLRSSKRTGTMAFMAPETFNRDFGFKADVWGLGISLYWLHAQRLPYWSTADTPRAPTLEDMVQAVQHGAIPFDYGPWLQMSPEGLDFISCCLTRCEGDRLGVEQALQHPWLKIHRR